MIPFSNFFKRMEEELQARTVQLIAANKKLEKALSRIKQLNELLPICAVCKKIRDDEGYRHQVEGYIYDHTGTEFSHGYCPDCEARVIAESKKD